MKKTLTYLTAGALFLGSYIHLQAAHLRGSLLATAKLEGAQQTPTPVTTNAVGIASVFLTPGLDSAYVNISVNGLSGPITGVHIHEGTAGSAGPVLIDLVPYLNGKRVVGLLKSDVITKSFLRKLLKDSLYINVHTAANPNGEIRGQLSIESDGGYTAKLNALNQVPTLALPGYGLGTVFLSKDKTKLKVYAVVQELSGAITAAHLHTGAAGVNGPVAVTLTVDGNVISGDVDNPDATLLTNLASGNIYLNVHTAANANGEVRGQVWWNKSLSFDVKLDGAQQVPPLTLPGKGVASVKFSPTLDTLWYDAVVTNLSGAITAAHFHKAAVGVNGGVVVDLTPGITANKLSGQITGSVITKELISDFLTGNIYLNVHTTANPGGEVRGQVYRLAREGYTLSLQGAQQTPPVVTTATGSGIVSIDRDQTNAHYMIVVSDLSGPATAAHFHKAKAGVAGGVIYDLSPNFAKTGTNDAAFGYWTSANGFNLAQSVAFRNDSIYVNVHTALNPNGEVRGQVVRDAKPSVIVTAIEENYISSSTFSLYPNPAENTTTLRFESRMAGAGRISVSDAAGREVSSINATILSGNNAKDLNVAGLNAGIYYVTIQTGQGQVVKKLVKN